MRDGASFYRCDDCGSKRFVGRAEWQLRSKPKYMECGCTFLVEFSPGAKQDTLDRSSAAVRDRHRRKDEAERSDPAR